jgi:hypothetical protein
MEYTLSSLLDILGAFLLGMFIMEKIIFYRISKSLREAGLDIDEDETEETEQIEVKKFFVENLDGLLYLYEHPTNKFICQGKLLTELASLSNKYEKAEVACVINYDKEVVWFVNGEVRKELNAD